MSQLASVSVCVDITVCQKRKLRGRFRNQETWCIMTEEAVN